MTRRLGPDELYALRQIPLPAVLRASGARRDRSDRQKWLTAQGSLSVTGMQFMNWHRGRGGGGAIDLVMHLENLDFPAAVAWLQRRFFLPAPAASARPAARPLRLPSPDASQWSAVERYLVRQRALPEKLLAALLQSETLCRHSAECCLPPARRRPSAGGGRTARHRAGPLAWPGPRLPLRSRLLSGAAGFPHQYRVV